MLKVYKYLCVFFPVSFANSLRSFFFSPSSFSRSCFHHSIVCVCVYFFMVLPRITSIHSPKVHCSITLCVPVYAMHSNSEIYVINHKIHWLLFKRSIHTRYSDTFNSIFLLSFWFVSILSIRCHCQFSTTELKIEKKKEKKSKLWTQRTIIEECIEHSTTNDHYNFFFSFRFFSFHFLVLESKGHGEKCF